MTHKVISFTSDGLELFGVLHLYDPKAPTILLLHGLGFHSFEYKLMAPLLLSQGLNCLAFDFRSHGNSQGARGLWTLQNLVDDTIRAVDNVEKNLQGPIGVFGNSMGATVAVYAAAQDQRIKSVVACNCATKPSEALFSPFRKFLLDISRGLNLFIPIRLSVNYFIPYTKILKYQDLIEMIKADDRITDARKFSPETYYEMYQWDAAEAARKVTVPILVLQSKNDSLQPIEQSIMLYDAANEPKKFHLLDAGHVPSLENPEQLALTVAAWFLQTLTNAS